MRRTSITDILVRSFIFFFFFVWLVVSANAQEYDSTFVEIASDTFEPDTGIVNAPPDTAKVMVRSFNSEDIRALKEDADLHYKQPPTVAETLWDRFLQWVREFLSSLFRSAFDTRWGNVIVYLIGIAVIVVVVMMILKVDAFRVLFSGTSGKLTHQVVDENIHEMDFEHLIADAVQQQDYRRGVRLLFLYALKLLSDRHFIHWENGKTNHEYVSEVKEKELRKGLNHLSLFFDYAWYGNFAITAATFAKAQAIFTDWKQKVN